MSWRSHNLRVDLFKNHNVVKEKTAISIIHYLSRQHGILLGGSSGLSIYAALESLKNESTNNALAICPDGGTNYLNTLYNADWLANKGVHVSAK